MSREQVTAAAGYGLRVGTLAAVYLVAARSGLLLATVGAQVTLVWPPTGIALAVLLLGGLRFWPGVAIAATLVNAATGVPLATASGMGLGNTLEALIAAGMLRRLGVLPSLERSGDVWALVVIAAGLSTVVSAGIGVVSLLFGGVIPRSAAISAWETWWLGDALGDLVVAPVLLIATTRPWRALGRRRGWEAGALLPATIVGSLAVFGGLFGTTNSYFALVYLIFPCALWAIVRFELPGAALFTGVVSGAAIWGATRGTGPFAQGAALRTTLLETQVFMGVVAVTALILAASIAERRRAEEAVRTSERRFRSLFEAAPIAIALRDAAGVNEAVNPAYCALYGYREEELVGQTGMMVFPEERRPEMAAMYAELFTVSPSIGEFAVRTREGRELHVLAAGAPLTDTDGRPLRAIFLVDLTERRRAERATEEAMRVAAELAHLRQQQVQEAEAMAAVGAALATTLDPAELYGIILEQAARVLPFDHAEIVLYQDGWAISAACRGEPCVAPGTPLARLDTSTGTWQALKQGTVAYLADTAELEGWQDTPPWVGPHRIRSSIRVPLMGEGELLGTFGLSSVTPHAYTPGQVQVAAAFGIRAAQAVRNARLYEAEQRRRRAAEELAALRSGFVASVSHEMRTPLTAIVGFGELLQAYWEQIPEAQRRRRIDQIVRAAQRQKRLVEDLLLTTRLEGATLAPDRAVLFLAPLVEQAAEELRASYPGQSVVLRGPAGLRVRADGACALRVLSNLLDNAAKYSPEGSPIHIRWGRQGRMVAVRVVDRGPGVPTEGRERLFARFGRLEGSAIRAGHVGTGLGLYLSRELARAMGGELDLEATGQQGSTFRLRLPAVAGVSAPLAGEPPPG